MIAARVGPILAAHRALGAPPVPAAPYVADVVDVVDSSAHCGEVMVLILLMVYDVVESCGVGDVE